MSNKIGIYITGLGQSIDNETVEKYAERLKNELSFKTDGTFYHLKIEKEIYPIDKDCTLVKIYRKDRKDKDDKNIDGELVYKIYDFQYHRILTDRFQRYNIIIKNLLLFVLVLKKFPQIILRLFNGNGFSRPLQTLYAFLILLTISTCVLFLIPGCIDLIISNTGKGATENINDFFCFFHSKYSIDNNKAIILSSYSKKILSITTLILLFAPRSKTILTSLATEFSCVDSYITNGEQSQILLGNLDQLVEYIAENEPNPEIHFHSYSFGSILAIDALFPIAKIPPSDNIKKLTKLLITTGSPFEFINAYYPSFYDNRCDVMKDHLKWLNIYSISDVFSTNFRRDSRRGEAEFGIKDISLIPENINYEITSDRPGIISFFSLNSIKMHKCYWDSLTIGQSCMKVLLPVMLREKLIKV